MLLIDNDDAELLLIDDESHDGASQPGGLTKQTRYKTIQISRQFTNDG